MTSSEYADWLAFVAQFTGPNRSNRPCAECPAAYAAEMGALGRCNGMPRG